MLFNVNMLNGDLQSLTGLPVTVDAVLDQIEINAEKDGLVLKDNWRIITERNIEIWSNTAKEKGGKRSE